MSDALTNNVVLHLPFDELSLCRGAIDVSSYRRRVSGPIEIKPGGPFGGAYGYFSGGGCGVSVDVGEFGALDFCIEAWVNVFSNTIYQRIFNYGYTKSSESFYSAACALSPGFEPFCDRGILGNGYSRIVSSSVKESINTWHHFALTRSGSDFTLWVDGYAIGVGTYSGSFSGGVLAIGNNGSGGEGLVGGLHDFRVTLGVPRYTNTFAPGKIEYDFEAPVAKSGAGLVRALSWQPDALAAVRPLAPCARSRDIYYGGRGRIAGTVERVGDVPLIRRVRLFRDRDGVCVAETWSSAAGAYVFTDIDPAERYSVIAYDHEHNYRAVIADNLVPELMA